MCLLKRQSCPPLQRQFHLVRLCRPAPPPPSCLSGGAKHRSKSPRHVFVTSCPCRHLGWHRTSGCCPGIPRPGHEILGTPTVVRHQPDPGRRRQADLPDQLGRLLPIRLPRRLPAARHQHLRERPVSINTESTPGRGGKGKESTKSRWANTTLDRGVKYRNGWGASAIDALSTALIMGNQDVVLQILEYVPTIDFSVSYNDTAVSLFETTIRYLGGLLSGMLLPFSAKKKGILGPTRTDTLHSNTKKKKGTTSSQALSPRSTVTQVSPTPSSPRPKTWLTTSSSPLTPPRASRTTTYTSTRPASPIHPPTASPLSAPWSWSGRASRT